MKQLEMNRLHQRRQYLREIKRLLISALKNLSIRDWIGNRGSSDQNAADFLLHCACRRRSLQEILMSRRETF